MQARGAAASRWSVDTVKLRLRGFEELLWRWSAVRWLLKALRDSGLFRRNRFRCC
jgi:hypothetical protein